MPVPGSQMRIVPSAPPVTTVPSAANSAFRTGPRWPRSSRAGHPLRRHVRAVPSLLAVTSTPPRPERDVAHVGRVPEQRRERAVPSDAPHPARSDRCSPSRSARPSGRTPPRAPGRCARAAGHDLAPRRRAPDAPGLVASARDDQPPVRRERGVRDDAGMLDAAQPRAGRERDHARPRLADRARSPTRRPGSGRAPPRRREAQTGTGLPRGSPVAVSSVTSARVGDQRRPSARPSTNAAAPPSTGCDHRSLPVSSS